MVKPNSQQQGKSKIKKNNFKKQVPKTNKPNNDKRINKKQETPNNDKRINKKQEKPSNDKKINKKQEKKEEIVEEQPKVEEKTEKIENAEISETKVEQTDKTVDSKVEEVKIDNLEIEMQENGFLSTKKYSELALFPELQENIKKSGFEYMTEIQAKSIPLILAGKNILGQARTGSGKTLAFLIPGIELLHRAKFLRRNGTGIIIISPTRELALQIFSCAKELTEGTNHTVCTCIGGESKTAEARKLLNGTNIIVATPGRLLDHLLNTSFIHKNLLSLVIDEADRILEQGFEEEMKAILKLLPKTRQSMLFSATQTSKVCEIAQLLFSNEKKNAPISVGIKPKQNEEDIDLENESIKRDLVKTLKQGYVMVQANLRFSLLYSFLKRNKRKKIMVFFSSCREVTFFHAILQYIGFPVVCLHGQLPQKQRTDTFFSFVNAEKGILLSTDVAARGLDIPNVDWIIQYDAPDNPREYIHRVGRTARAGKKGSAVMFLLPTEKMMLNHLKAEGVPLNEISFPESKISNIQAKFFSIIETNYYLYKEAVEGFQSYIKSYASYGMKDVFNFKTLDVEGVASSFGLPEVPYVQLQNLSTGIDPEKSEKFQKAKKRKDAPTKQVKNEEEEEEEEDEEEEVKQPPKKKQKVQ